MDVAAGEHFHPSRGGDPLCTPDCFATARASVANLHRSAVRTCSDECPPCHPRPLHLGRASPRGRDRRAIGAATLEWKRVARLAMAGILAIGLAFVTATISQRDRALRGGSTVESPNVLVLILDTVRAASTSLHGYARSTTPHLDRLAREGAMFEWAIAPSSWTLPSHAAMFTGRRASTLSTSWRRPLDDTHATVAEAFRKAGYATGAFVGNPFYTHHESGIGRGFDVLRDFRRSQLQLFWSTTLGQTPFVNAVIWERTPAALVTAIKNVRPAGALGAAVRPPMVA